MDEADRPTGPTAFEDVDEALLTRVVRLAAENADAGQLPFGALVLRAGVVVATGVNTALRDLDPTAHAEIAAIRAACAKLGVLELTGATVVSSCEPCAICHTVAASAGVARIVYAAPKEYAGQLGDPGPDDPHELLTRMQAAVRAEAPEQVVYLPTEGADEPFRRYLASQAR